MTRVFVDVTVTNSKREKKHYCYNPIDSRYFKVSSLTELKHYDEVYIDMLLSSNYAEIRELLSSDSKVFLLRESNLVKKMRQQNNLRKMMKTMHTSYH